MFNDPDSNASITNSVHACQQSIINLVEAGRHKSVAAWMVVSKWLDAAYMGLVASSGNLKVILQDFGQYCIVATRSTVNFTRDIWIENFGSVASVKP